jgi:SAM-dependent methyltransferase
MKGTQESRAARYDRRFHGPRRRYLAALEDDPVLQMAGSLAGCTVLDLGTGNGRFAGLAASHEARQVVGVDIEPEMVRFAKGQLTDSRHDWAVMDMHRLAFAPSSFDCVFAIGTFERLPAGSRLADLLAELARVLRPSGKLVFTVWNRDRFFSFDLIDFGTNVPTQFTRPEIEEAVSRGGLRLIKSCSTFFEPRRIVPLLLPVGSSAPVNETIATWLIWANRRLGAGTSSALKGRELIALAQKV